MNPTELKINRLNTTAFIGEKPSEIALIPRNRNKTPGGGWVYEEIPARIPQTFRIIELGMNATPPILTLTDGKQREAEFWLLGEWDAAIDIDDVWEMADEATGNVRKWVVGDIIRTNHYETRALVAERGK